MASRRKRRSSASSPKTPYIIGTVLFLLAIGMFAGFGHLLLKAESQVALDKTSLCPVDGPRSITAVLLDVTDPISDATSIDLRNEFQEAVANIPIGGLLQVYALTEEEGKLTRTFSGCNPGNGESVDQWTSNPRLAQHRWEQGFQKPLSELAGRISEGSTGRQSPIMAGIQRINLEAFGLPAYRSLPKTLIVASDMIEHTSAFSMYGDGPSFKKFEASDARNRFRTPLEGVSVRVLEFQRPGMKFSAEDLAAFWNEWVGSNAGVMTSFKRLQGVM